MVYPALLPLMRKHRLPVVDWTDAPRRFNWTRPFHRKTKNLVSARAPARHAPKLRSVVCHLAGHKWDRTQASSQHTDADCVRKAPVAADAVFRRENGGRCSIPVQGFSFNLVAAVKWADTNANFNQCDPTSHADKNKKNRSWRWPSTWSKHVDGAILLYVAVKSSSVPAGCLQEVPLERAPAARRLATG